MSHCRTSLWSWSVLGNFALILALAAFYLSAHQSFRLLSVDETSSYFVGDSTPSPNHCCIKSTKSDCADQPAFQCSDAQTKTCTMNQSFKTTCASANCNTSLNGKTCATTVVPRTFNECIVNGMTTTGCPDGQAKCTFTTRLINLDVTACSSNFDACPTGQPSASCD